MKGLYASGAVLLMMLFTTSTPSLADAPTLPQPGQCWWPQLELILAAATGAPSPSGSFTNAVDFLQVNTGIESGFDMTFVGYIGTPRQTVRAFKAWSTWFMENYPYLYWEPTRHVFLVDADAKSERRATSRARGPADGDCLPTQPTCEQVFGPGAELCRLIEAAKQ